MDTKKPLDTLERKYIYIYILARVIYILKSRVPTLRYLPRFERIFWRTYFSIHLYAARNDHVENPSGRLTQTRLRYGNLKFSFSYCARYTKPPFAAVVRSLFRTSNEPTNSIPERIANFSRYSRPFVEQFRPSVFPNTVVEACRARGRYIRKRTLRFGTL